VAFTPADSANYTTAEASVTVSVARQTPSLEWPEPEPIICGAQLGDAQLNATSSVPGEFVYQPGAGEVLGAGTHTLTAIFTPADDAHYSPAQASVTITVAKAMPVIDWPQPDPITYGELLGDAQLAATASVPGAFAFNPCAGALLAAGEHTPSVVFTPEDASNYESAQAAVQLTVLQATPVISWPALDPIAFGEALGDAQFNATASVAGAFAYVPEAGELLAPGSHELTVTFTPADGLNYTDAEASASLTVVETLPTEIGWPTPPAISYGTPLGDTQLNATAPVPGAFVYTPAAGNVLAPGTYTLQAAFTPEDSLRYAPAQATVDLVVEDSARIATAEEPAPVAEAEEPEPVAAVEDIASDPSPEELARIAVLEEYARIDVAEAQAPDAEEQSEPERPLFALTAVAWNDIFPDAEQEPAKVSAPPQNIYRETRTYKGATYEKGEDGQWHLQQK
jgi:hypothetical protein